MKRRGGISQCYVGLEFNHSEPPSAYVWPASRPLKVAKWVDDGPPRWTFDAKGEKVLRERIGIKLPVGFRFTEDEVKGVMKAKKCTYQDAKFYIAMYSARGIQKHPMSVEMDKAAKAKAEAAEKAKADAETKEPEVKEDDAKTDKASS
jgi:hypothetical protein